MRSRLSTHERRSGDRFHYWQQYICDFCLQIDTKRLSSDPFFGEVSSFSIEQLDIATIQSSAVEVLQRKQHIAHAVDRFFKVTVQLDGTGILRQRARELVLRPGDWTFYDSAEPYELLFPDRYRQLILKVPASTLSGHIPLVESFAVQRLDPDDGLSTLAKQMMLNISESYENLKAAHHKRLAQMLIELVAAGINSSVLQHELENGRGSVWYLKMRAYIDANFQDSALNVDAIATHFNFSTRYVHALFKQHGVSVTKLIHQKRLAYAAQLLGDALHQHRSIGEIARMAGFNSDSHFRNSFKQQTKLSPKAYRHRKRQTASIG